ncbi:MAG: hypothetical protein U0Q12_19085 [Vicinamibacterales bacterium]
MTRLRSSPHLRGAATAVVCVVFGAAVPHAATGPRLQESHAEVTWSSSTDCRVTQHFVVASGDAMSVSHRIVVYPGATIEETEVSGEGVASLPMGDAGRTQRLDVTGARGSEWRYSVAYRARVTPEWAYRCPLWLPDAPSTGALDRMHVDVALPAAALPLPDAFPALAWDGGRGRAALANLPIMVRTPFDDPSTGIAPGSFDRLGRRRLVDVITVAAVVIASGGWLANRRRRQRGRSSS